MFSMLNITPFNLSVTVVGYCASRFGGEKGRIIYHNHRLGICRWVYLAEFCGGLSKPSWRNAVCFALKSSKL